MKIKHDVIIVTLLIILWALIFYPVYPGLVEAWFGMVNSDNSYGVLVPFISLYFIWIKRDQLNKAVSSSYLLGLAILIASLIIYLISYVGGVYFLQRLMMVLSLIGLMLYLFGKKIFSILAFPLIFLFFMVPIPESIVGMVAFPLQTYATIISSKIIQLCGIEVYREGHMLYFIQTQLEVAEACSGIRSVTAMLMLSVIFMNQCDNGRIQKTIIISSSIIIAFVANILRVSGTGILAHFFGAKVAKGFLHEFSGMAVFVFGFLMLFLEYKLLNWKWFQGDK